MKTTRVKLTTAIAVPSRRTGHLFLEAGAEFDAVTLNVEHCVDLIVGEAKHSVLAFRQEYEVINE